MIMKDIDYKKITDYYYDIILYILNNLSYSRIKYDYTGEDFTPTNHTEDEYEAEYLNAYGYLQRAEWRLSEVDMMSDFYDETDFFYFGLENLSSARHRIQHYLENTEWDIFNDLNYKQYDDLVMDYYQPIRLGKSGWEEYYEVSHDKWKYYWKLHSIVQLTKYLREDCVEIINKLTKFVEYIDEMDYDVLSEHSKELECLNNKTLDFLIDIPNVRLIEEIVEKRKELESE